jgi:hypothetical protein
MTANAGIDSETPAPLAALHRGKRSDFPLHTANLSDRLAHTRIIPPSLRRRAVGRCSTDAMSEVIERDALMSSAKPSRKGAPVLRVKTSLISRAYRIRRDKPAGSKPRGEHRALREQRKPARRRRSSRGVKDLLALSRWKPITGRGWSASTAPFTRRTFAGASHPRPALRSLFAQTKSDNEKVPRTMRNKDDACLRRIPAPRKRFIGAG